ncbi:hypothetical protein VNI00_002561 [Paramarasmius palmivorus]|uniref:G-protein coupled receptors family 2 profile 2 domain-containing protein n=1 Tax=Paramarasmius palmivorus TaxID=297713 RepID=A0AAW0DVB4_9AGAR
MGDVQAGPEPVQAEANKWEMGVWIYFNLVSSNILLPILVATFTFSKTAKRHATLINMCMTWIFSGIFSLLRFYEGLGQTSGGQSNTICLAQAYLMYGIMPMWAVAVLVMVVYIYGVINDCAFLKGKRRVALLLMLSAPYIAQASFTIAAVVVGMKSKPMELNQLAFVVFKNWRSRRRAGPSYTDNDTRTILRVLVFGLYVFAGMICNCIRLFKPDNAVPYMYAAVAGTVVFLIFGTQSDVLRAWCFWKTAEPEPRTHDYLRGQMDWTTRPLSLDTGKAEAGVGAVPSRSPPEPPRAQVVQHMHNTEEINNVNSRSTKMWV